MFVCDGVIGTNFFNWFFYKLFYGLKTGENMKFKILCEKGDAPYNYEGPMAKIKFDELKSDGYLPMKVENSQHLPMKVFDPTAEEIVWVPGIMGG